VSILTKIFWTVVILDAIAAVVIWKLFEGGTNGLLVLAFLIVLAAIVIPTCIFPLLRSEGLRITAFVFLMLPSAPLLFTSVAAAVNTVREQRQFSGSAYFQGPALDLAQAMVKRDPVSVKQLIPAAGDLNQPHGRGITLWQFGVLQADNTEESIDMLRSLIAAGADPKRDASSDTLEHATAVGPRLTQFLLDSGANPNVLDHDHRPVWWRTMDRGDDDSATELLTLMLNHAADLSLRADGRGPVGQAIASRYWYVACLLIERGADWKQEKPRGESVPQLLDWEILRREEYTLPVPEKLRKVLAEIKGEPLIIPPAPARSAGDIRIPDLLHDTSFDKLDQARASLSRLAEQRPDWVRRVVAFFEEGDGTQRNQVALLLSLKPEALPEDVQERCWTVLREQIAWYDRSAASYPNESKGWLLKDTGVIATGLASIPGPVRDRHKSDFIALRDRIEERRKAKDPDASKLADLKNADWIAR
jgi:hypothetical protein